MVEINNENEYEEFGWDEEISEDGTPFVVLPAGDYPFTVTKFERSKFTPGQNSQSKIPAGTNMAVLTLTFKGPNGETVITTENLFLIKKMKWKFSEFFRSIGQKKKDVPFVADWSKVLGATGKATLEVNNYTKKDGNPGQNNRVKNFIDKKENQAGNWTPGGGPVSDSKPQNVTPFGGSWK